MTAGSFGNRLGGGGSPSYITATTAFVRREPGRHPHGAYDSDGNVTAGSGRSGRGEPGGGGGGAGEVQPVEDWSHPPELPEAAGRASDWDSSSGDDDPHDPYNDHLLDVP